MNQYTVNAGNVVHDTIDGEVLAIRSDTGAYYSMTATAASVWSSAVAGGTSDEISARVATHHGAPVDQVRDDVQRLLDQLVDEQLLLVGDHASAGEATLPPETAGTAWSAPATEKYTDMQDLLLFDPIHEVKPSGWPRADPES